MNPLNYAENYVGNQPVRSACLGQGTGDFGMAKSKRDDYDSSSVSVFWAQGKGDCMSLENESSPLVSVSVTPVATEPKGASGMGNIPALMLALVGMGFAGSQFFSQYQSSRSLNAMSSSGGVCCTSKKSCCSKGTETVAAAGGCCASRCSSTAAPAAEEVAILPDFDEEPVSAEAAVNL